MNKVWMIALLVCAGCGSAPARFFPLSVGMQWDYRVEGSPDRVTGFRWDVHSRMLGDEYLVDVVTETHEGAEVRRQLTHSVFRWDEKGLWVEDLSRPENSSRYLLVGAPVKPGTEWQAGSMKARVEAMEAVETPAGRFASAARVRYLRPESPGLALEIWLVPGVGMVKQQSLKDGKPEWTAVLASAGRKGP